MSAGLSALLLACAAWAGPADRVLAGMDASPARAPAVALSAAQRGARQPRTATRGLSTRASAWLVVGRLGVADPEIIALADQTLREGRTPPAVRARAAWALGELARGQAPAVVGPINEALMGAMHVDLDAETAQQVVEAFAKSWGPHAHSLDEDLRAARALNALAARQRDALPGAWALVMDRVLSPPLVARLLTESLAAARARPTPDALAEVYSAALTAARFLAGRREALLHKLPEARAAVEAAFGALLDTLSLENRQLTLMVLWSLGAQAGDPAFAAMVGPGVAARPPSADPVERWLQAWALHQLRADLSARGGLRALVGAEADLNTLRLLGAMRAPKAQDPLQRVTAVEPEAQP